MFRSSQPSVKGPVAADSDCVLFVGCVQPSKNLCEVGYSLALIGPRRPAFGISNSSSFYETLTSFPPSNFRYSRTTALRPLGYISTASAAPTALFHQTRLCPNVPDVTSIQRQKVSMQHTYEGYRSLP